MSLTEDYLNQYFRQDAFHSLERHLARHICRLEKTFSPELYLATALLAFEMSSGNVCLNLNAYAGKDLTALLRLEGESLTLPSLDEWLEVLKQQSVGQPSGEGFSPLVLEYSDTKPLLYFRRYWEYEDNLVQNIKQRLGAMEAIDEATESLLQAYFQDSANDPYPIEVARSALKTRFSVITGGPGTGKTTIVVKLLSLLLEQHSAVFPGKNFNYALAAPTGKAADRLSRSIAERKENLKNLGLISSSTYQNLHEQTSTIHRLLGYQSGKVTFRHYEGNPLDLDCLIIDEASMIDLALMSKLIDAVPDHTRLILLGDPFQLASVEAGSVLQDIYESLQGSEFQIHVGKLMKSHRFSAEEGIGKLSYLVNSNQPEEALQCLTDESQHDVSLINYQPGQSIKNLIQMKQEHFEALLHSKTPVEAFENYHHLIFLSPLRKGGFGVETINRMVEEMLEHEWLIQPGQRWYHGKPVLITSNDYNLQLFNGDVGICLKDKNDGQLRVWFQSEDGFRVFLPSRLPDFETAWALTIHKSQGSEYEQVFLILPDKDLTMISRELIYTAITRAKKQVTIAAGEQVLKNGISRKRERASALISRLNTPLV